MTTTLAAALEKLEQQRQAVQRYLSLTGNDLCHENRTWLATAFGLQPPPVGLIPECEFAANCYGYREELYGGGPPGPADEHYQLWLEVQRQRCLAKALAERVALQSEILTEHSLRHGSFTAAPPSQYGWYWWALRREDLDLAYPIPVTQHKESGTPDRAYCTTQVRYLSSLARSRWPEKKDGNVDVAEVGGFWSGPIRQPNQKVV